MERLGECQERLGGAGRRGINITSSRSTLFSKSFSSNPALSHRLSSWSRSLSVGVSIFGGHFRTFFRSCVREHGNKSLDRWYVCCIESGKRGVALSSFEYEVKKAALATSPSDQTLLMAQTMAEGVKPPSRIRVISHEPLKVIRAWIAIPAPSSTVSDLIELLSPMLGGANIQLELLGGLGKALGIGRKVLRKLTGMAYCRV